MGFIKNMKISAKLILLSAIALILMVVMLFVAVNGFNELEELDNYKYDTIIVPTAKVIDISLSLETIGKRLRDLALATSMEENQKYKQMIDDAFPLLKKAIDEYSAILKEHNVTSGDEYNYLKAISDSYVPYKDAVDRAIALGMNNETAGVIEIIKKETSVTAGILVDNLHKIAALNVQQARIATDQATAAKNMALLQMGAAIVVAAILLIGFAIIVINAITKPVNQMVSVANNVAKGNLNVNVSVDSKDEMGILGGEFLTLITTLRTLIDDLAHVTKEHGEKGNTEATIDVNKYQGAYKELATGLNTMLGDYVGMSTDILNCVNQFGEGNFDSDIKKYPGKKQFANQSIDALRVNMKAVGSDIQGLINAASDGKLSHRADDTKYKGTWNGIVSGLNTLMKTIAEPIMESADVMGKLAKGDFSDNVRGNYKGDFALIKNSLNTTVENMASYIKEIADVLDKLAHNDFNQEIKRPYVGEFANIRTAVNAIIDKMNQVLRDIQSAAEQVTVGAKQLSESSMTLAQGATEQASSVEELNATIDTINEQTQRNASKAENANNLSVSSMSNATKGNAEMQMMLKSMEGIKNSSANISKIIKVIEDIAFQTNLLALNAAVEAARAGEHGKGFAVVAEEVRSLAARSQKAAQETTELIENSINQVNDGTKIATVTANALETIVADVKEVSGIISEISEASKEQAASIAQVSIGLGQISQVVQSNSATSEEAASASEEMASQAETLDSMVAIFKLR